MPRTRPKRDGNPADTAVDNPLASWQDSLLDLGLPADTKLTARIRPLARDLLLQLDPQDAAERMLVVQMIASFSRSIYLSRNANLQKHPKWFALYSSECDRAMALFRRQMQTLDDLRRPRRTTFNSIRQANIAHQQVVVTDPEPKARNTRLNNAKPVAQKNPTTLSTHPSRPRRSACKRPKKPPLAT